ncbi:hypothetical protein B0T17DRAFT_367616 [Bombardia bombarda]|uniref:Uncharacterized protein n=1 Tax=Bombardia bombarda TaxID=252184 RepID=A0AA40BWB6_9PEZI|nr:hypothetical protein B0T17DRAFT_367616 [Bombardia bombarda]
MRLAFSSRHHTKTYTTKRPKSPNTKRQTDDKISDIHISPLSSNSLAQAMCHFAILRSSCGHSELFQLHCKDNNASQLCEPPRRRVLARYRVRSRCVDCDNEEWDRRDEERLASIDDRLADFARMSASGTLSADDHHLLVRRLAVWDKKLEQHAAEARAEQLASVIYARDWARRHAKALWSLHHARDRPAAYYQAQLRMLSRSKLAGIDVLTKLPMALPVKLPTAVAV